MKGPAAVRELQVFCDLPAEAAICEAAAFFTERGLKITRQDPHSLGLLGPTAAAPSTDQPGRLARYAIQRTAAPLATGKLGAADAARQPRYSARCRCGGCGHCPGGPRQVPRLADGGRARAQVAAAAAALVAHWRPRSAAAAAAVTAKERNVFTERGWAEREAAVRANWRQSGVPPAEVEQRLDKLRQRWAHIANKTEPEGE